MLSFCQYCVSRELSSSPDRIALSSIDQVHLNPTSGGASEKNVLLRREKVIL